MLASGIRLGTYEVLAKIGEGGMGEVYRARDTKLGRDVALKILPEIFAADVERLARFRREAQVLAALNHSNIAQIYGFEETPADARHYAPGAAADAGSGSSGTLHALVMELVEGPTLADRIAHGPIPLDEALAIARQIGAALESAHERGIVHRDLKPANIKLRDDGTVKVLDFGLAKLVAADLPAPAASPSSSLSPTMTSPAMVPLASAQATHGAVTGVGALLGTASYMSPEQAKGRDADKRADIFAFGCVLYEMLTGRRAFEGADVGETIAAVIRAQPDWSGVPDRVRPLLESCLEKDPKLRLRDIGDAWRLIDHERESVSPRGRWHSVLPWAITAIALTGVAAALVLPRRVESTGAVQFTVGPSPAAVFRYLFTGAAVSPDGGMIIFSGFDGAGGANQLYLRPVDSLVARPLAGTANADSPFWSPDGASLAFFSEGKLRRIDVRGGTPFVLTDAAGGAGGGTWNRSGTILFAAKGGLYSVPAGGGPASLVLGETAGSQTRTRIFPQFLPDGDRFIYLSLSGRDAKNTGIWVSSLSRPQDERQLVATQYKALYAAGDGNAPGHLLFVRDTTLMAQVFDPKDLTLSGEPVPITTDLTVSNANRWATFWAADAHALMFRSGGSVRDRATLVWLDRSGRAIGDAGPENVYSSMRLSPDGHHLAVGLRDPAGVDDQWMLDIDRGTMSRFTFDASRETWPVWSPDGRQLAFSSDRSGTYQIYRKDARGTAAEQQVTSGGSTKAPTDWSPDGKYLLYAEIDLNDGDDLWALPLAADSKPIPLVRTPFSDQSAEFSPDGKWIAYQSNESGRFEIYLQTFPPSGGKWQVSTGGGRAPRWRGDGRELFFVTPTEDSQAMMAVDVQVSADDVQLGTPHRLFSTSIPTANSYSYDVTRDGQRFIVQQLLPQASAPPLTVILNWPALLANRTESQPR